MRIDNNGGSGSQTPVNNNQTLTSSSESNGNEDNIQVVNPGNSPIPSETPSSRASVDLIEGQSPKKFYDSTISEGSDDDDSEEDDTGMQALYDEFKKHSIITQDISNKNFNTETCLEVISNASELNINKCEKVFLSIFSLQEDGCLRVINGKVLPTKSTGSLPLKVMKAFIEKSPSILATLTQENLKNSLLYNLNELSNYAETDINQLIEDEDATLASLHFCIIACSQYNILDAVIKQLQEKEESENLLNVHLDFLAQQEILVPRINTKPAEK